MTNINRLAFLNLGNYSGSTGGQFHDDDFSEILWGKVPADRENLQ